MDRQGETNKHQTILQGDIKIIQHDKGVTFQAMTAFSSNYSILFPWSAGDI